MTKIFLTLITFLLYFNTNLVTGQQFSKITTGSIVTDAGQSRSVNWLDLNNDGYLDLFVTNGPGAGANAFLYINNGDGTFTKVESNPVSSTPFKAVGSSWGDYNNDGNPDLCVTTWYNQVNFLFKNNGYPDIEFMPASPVSTLTGYSEACAWGDLNGDGYLDLVITNSDGHNRNYLFINDQMGDFIRVDTGSVATDAFFSRGVDIVDINGDGLQDIYVCNESNQKNSLYINMGNGYFEKINDHALVNDNRTSWGASWGDFNNDGILDVFIANWNQNNQLFMGTGNGDYVSIDTGIVSNDGGYSTTGVWGDFDNDGDLDLFVTNSFGSGQLTNFLYKNMLMESGVAYFEKISSGDIVSDLGWTYGAAWGDYDRDGYIDLFAANTFSTQGQNNALYKNAMSGNNWVGLNLVGVTSNASGFGSIVKIYSMINDNPVLQTKPMLSNSGYCSQTMQLNFGLGDAATIDSIVILWQSGTKDVFSNVEVNKYYYATEGNSLSVSIQAIETELASDFELYQNYPNPFNPETKIKFSLPASDFVTLKIFNALGQEVSTLLSSHLQAGVYEFSFNARDFPTGVYFYELKSESSTLVKKMMLIK